MSRLTENVLGDSILTRILADEIALEETAIAEGAKRYRDNVADATKRGSAAGLKSGERFLIHWLEPLVAMIEREQEEVAAGVAKKKGVNVWGPLIGLIDARRMAVATIYGALGECLREPSGTKFGTLCYTIGTSIVAEAHKDMLKDSDEDAWRQLERRVKSITVRKINWWAKKSLQDPIHSRSAAIHLGSVMLDLLVNSASAGDYEDEVFDPAFKIERRNEERTRPNYVVLSERVRREVSRSHEVRQFLRPKKLPMIYPPAPWSSTSRGGYIKIVSKLVSNSNEEQEEAIASADMASFYERFNAISRTPWRIRKRCLRVLESIWDGGGCRVFPNGTIELRVPPQDDPLYPPKPAGYDSDAKDPWENVDDKIKETYKKESTRIYEAIKLIEPAREEFLRKLWIMRRFAGYQEFYFPHRADFRWRCYPDVPHFSHHGDDVCRGVLEFANAVPVTDKGRRWIKIHAANCFGFDKAPFDARVAWIDSQMEHIKRVAHDPEGCDYWRPQYNAAGKQVGGPKKPWQFLSTCFALCFEEEAAHHAVQIDGSCNGLQHYSAIGRDEDGARLVNVAPTDKPADVYTAVADALVPMVEDDSRNSDKIIRWKSKGNKKNEKPVKQVAKECLDIIERSVVKQTVMTKVYGVTPNGAKGQIYNRLRESGVEDKALYAASAYLSRKVLESIGATCTGASRIMDYIRKCARNIADAGYVVRWTNLLGCPIVQPYRDLKHFTIVTVKQIVVIEKPDKTMPVLVEKHVNSSAPDFIHSVDAVHMLNTGFECSERNVDFAAVHDGYFGHAENTDTLHRITVDEFVKLHRVPLLQRLCDEWRRIYPGVEIPDPPAPGTFDIEQTSHSLYLFG